MNKNKTNNNMARITVIGSLIIAIILILGTVWMGRNANKSSEQAVHTVSLLYLDELAGRREQVVENNLQGNINNINTSISLMESGDLKSIASLQAYQRRIKQLYKLEKFAFVDTNGLIYTSLGTFNNIDEYSFDYKTIKKPEVSVLNLKSANKKVIIAIPTDIGFKDTKLCVCFMEIDMAVMLADFSMEMQKNDATFCNIYTKEGIALSDTILGGLSKEDNLLIAMKNADMYKGYSYDCFLRDFQRGRRGQVSFTYNGIRETLSYVPVKGTNWMLTYLIRESVISEKIAFISQAILRKSILLSTLTVIVMIIMFFFITVQAKKNSALLLERETAQAEAKGKQEELERRIALQAQLEKQSQLLSEALTIAEQANKAKTAFLSNMSHEIRTPMNAIIGLDSIALNDPGTPNKTKDYLEKIGTSANHLLNLINDILDMSRIESGRMTLKNEEFSFPKLLEAVNTIFSGQCQDKGLDYQCHINGEIDDYYIGDNMKLRQVLINILGNAVKFTPKGGKVELQAERTARYKGKTTLTFKISDTGIGMSEEFIPRLFDSFSQEDASATNKYGSSGLGMAITKNIVEMMNGEIRVKSSKGKGTVFTVTVTLSDSDRKAGCADDEIRPGDMTVLIVDDDPVAREHAKLILEKAGIASELAASGQEAVEMVKMRQARMAPYNLILVDWKMPGMDGLETTRQIRSIVGGDSAIIILTAYRWDDILEKAIEAGVDSFISKPLFAAAVLEEFKSAIKKKDVSANKHTDKADLNGRRVLLAEDVEINAEIMTVLLQARGVEADLAANGKIAVDKFLEHEPGYYSAILMDMRMPEMDGLEASNIIRSSGRDDAETVPIIALTANAFDEDVQRSMQAGLNAHLTKPIQQDILYETLENLIKA
ncbi:response regulator [bacterium]|nr:response regulator [bacterium]